MAQKKYYWLKLMNNFFRQKEIKKLRKIAGGDTFTIIYQEMMLLSLENGGKLYFDDFGSDIAEEIALELDEAVENVRMTITYLMGHGLMTVHPDGTEYTLEKVPSMVGSETSAAERMRRHRERKNQNLLEGSNNVTPQLREGNGDCNNVTPQLHREEKRREDIESDIDIDIEQEKEKVPTSPKVDTNRITEQFDTLWSLYPKGRKQGKEVARKAFTKAIKNGVEYETIKNALIAYNKQIEIRKTDIQYVKMGSTWFNQKCWEDEYDTDAPSNNDVYGEKLGTWI